MERGLKLRNAAKEVGITPAYLSQLEKGRRTRPDPRILLRLAALYKQPLPWFLYEAGYIPAIEESEGFPGETWRMWGPTVGKPLLAQEAESALPELLGEPSFADWYEFARRQQESSAASLNAELHKALEFPPEIAEYEEHIFALPPDVRLALLFRLAGLIRNGRLILGSHPPADGNDESQKGGKK